MLNKLPQNILNRLERKHLNNETHTVLRAVSKSLRNSNSQLDKSYKESLRLEKIIKEMNKVISETSAILKRLKNGNHWEIVHQYENFANFNPNNKNYYTKTNEGKRELAMYAKLIQSDPIGESLNSAIKRNFEDHLNGLQKKRNDAYLVLLQMWIRYIKIRQPELNINYLIRIRNNLLPNKKSKLSGSNTTSPSKLEVSVKGKGSGKGSGKGRGSYGKGLGKGRGSYGKGSGKGSGKGKGSSKGSYGKGSGKGRGSYGKGRGSYGKGSGRGRGSYLLN